MQQLWNKKLRCFFCVGGCVVVEAASWVVRRGRCLFFVSRGSSRLRQVGVFSSSAEAVDYVKWWVCRRRRCCLFFVVSRAALAAFV